jgi:CRISPR-associated endonuclease/helicase Cas3/CRISPR-associated endonuclease Cas3-HD
MGNRQISVPLYASDDADEKLVHLEPVHQHADRRVLDARADHHAGYFDATEGFVITDSTVEARFL